LPKPDKNRPHHLVLLPPQPHPKEEEQGDVAVMPTPKTHSVGSTCTEKSYFAQLSSSNVRKQLVFVGPLGSVTL